MTLPNWTRLPRQAARAAFQRSRRGVTSWARRLKGSVATALRGVDRWLNQSVRGVFGFVESRLGPITVVWIVVVVALSIVFWEWLSASESGSTTIRNLGLVIAAVVALPLAIWRSKVAERQANTAQQDLLNERYQKGAEMLGSDLLAVRLGGIYALSHLTEDHPKQYHVQMMKLLCAFARHPTKDEGIKVKQRTEYKPRLREDVQTVMTAITTHHRRHLILEKEARFRLFLVDADLSAAVLSHTNLSRAFLSGAELRGALLERADLSDVWLDGADLRGARLNEADLSDARLDEADLFDAHLGTVNLCGAWLDEANLSGARLGGANLCGTQFRRTNLSAADLSINGDHPAIGLTQAQLDEACADPDHPPKLDGVLDAITGAQLEWRGKPLDD